MMTSVGSGREQARRRARGRRAGRAGARPRRACAGCAALFADAQGEAAEEAIVRAVAGGEDADRRAARIEAPAAGPRAR